MNAALERPILRQPSERQALFLSAPEDGVVYGGAAGGGKGLHVETDIPTPASFVRMGDRSYPSIRRMPSDALDTPSPSGRLADRPKHDILGGTDQ